MITKNDEKYLLDCLKMMKEIADEVIIIDLGSTDQTVDIAKKAGADVSHRNWNEDYSEVKNACLDLAKGRWVLFLQANETIVMEQLKKLPFLLKNPNAEGYLLYVDQRSKKNRISSPVQSLRLFRNRQEYRYRYRIFEQVPDELINNIKDAGVRIIQHADHTLFKDISITNILQEEIAKNPDDSYLNYIYGIQLLNENKHEESTVYLQRACEKVKESYLFAPHLYKCLSWSLISLKRKEEALSVLERGIKLFPVYTDFFVLRGELFKQEKQYEKAVHDLEQCLEIKKQPNAAIPKPEIHLSIVLETLAEVHEWQGNKQKALVYYQQAYDLNRMNQKLIYKIGELTKSVGSAQQLEKMLKTAVEEKNIGQLMILMDIHLQQRKYTQVIFCLDEAGSLLGNKDQVASIKFFCYMMLGKIKKADVYFSTIKKDSPLYDHILLQRMESCWLYNDWQKTEQLLKEIDQRESIDPHIKNLYHVLQDVLTEKIKSDSVKPLTPQEYKMVSILAENLLWKKQEKKAKLILPLLLHGHQGKEQYIKLIKLGQLWADRNDFTPIQVIFQSILHKDEKLEFKQKIIQHLLRKDYLLTANKVNNLGEAASLGTLDYVLWSRNFVWKLEKCIEKAQPRKSITKVNNTSPFKTKEKPSKALLAFYQNLRIKDKEASERTMEGNDTNKTCADIHFNIGEIFENMQKINEAFIAYLRSLQWDPENEQFQTKISNIFRNNQTECSAILERKCWQLEGSVFYQKEDFIYYILGLIHFKEQQFKKAYDYFEKIEDGKIIYPLVQAYIFSCLWCSGNEEEVRKQISGLNKAHHVMPIFFRICKGYVLDTLAEGSKEHINSEYIKEEQEKVMHNNFC